MTLEEQRAKEFAGLTNLLAAFETSTDIDQLSECTDRAFDAINELEECGIISRRERVQWGSEFSAARSDRLAELKLRLQPSDPTYCHDRTTPP